MSGIGRVDVMLVNPLFNRVSGATPLNVPLGLEYMKESLRDAGFATDVFNMDYQEPQGGGKHIPRHPSKEVFDKETILREQKKRVEDRQSRWWTEYENILRRLSPKIVGIGMVTPQYHSGAMAARIARETLPGVTIVAGGIHSTVMPEEILSSGCYDVAVISEGEKTIVKLARFFINGEGTLDDINGICFQRYGSMVRTPPVELIQDLDTLSFPKRDCILPSGHRSATAKYSATLITSRGCAFKCTFCARQSLWLHNKIRYRSVQNVIEELLYLKKNNELSYFYILDDTFNIKKDRVMDFCEELITRKMGMKWYCYLRADKLDEEQARLLKRAGMDTAYIGGESGSQEIMDKMKRGINKDQIRKAVSILKKERVYTNCSFIVGHPDETPKTLSETKSFIHELSSASAIIYFMVPYPGTEIFNQMHDAGKIATYDWFSYNMHSPSLIRRDHITDKQLIDTVHELNRTIFYRHKRERFRVLHPSYIWQKLKTIRSLSRLKHLLNKFLKTIEGKY